ncbi:MAG: pssR [Rhodospirillaceae bacterium]|nr:MAG: pssR [Rhodospirillaceae bacterium]
MTESIADKNRHRPHKRSWIRRAALAGRTILIRVRRWYLCTFWGMDLHPTCVISLKANLDRTNPRGVHIGAGTTVTFGVVILAHDLSRIVHAHTRIGNKCLIGAHSIILPGVTIGDECIIGAGSVVTKDVPPHSICVGNPAVVVKSGICTREKGMLQEAYETALDRNQDANARS